MLSSCPPPKAIAFPVLSPERTTAGAAGSSLVSATSTGEQVQRTPSGELPKEGKNVQEGAQGTRELHVILQIPPALRGSVFSGTGIPAGSPHPPRAGCEVFPGEHRPFPAEAPDQSKPRALSWCSGECSCRGGHKGNKGSRIPSKCINYFQWLPRANPLPLLPRAGCLGGRAAEGATGLPPAARGCGLKAAE